MRPNILMPIMIFMTRYYNCSRHFSRFVSVSQNLFRILLPAFFVIIIVFASSCKKEILTIGGDILPNGDFVSINSIDTFSVFSYTMYDDSSRTDLSPVSYLGQDYDPYFGSSYASFVSQIRLNAKWDGQPFTVDSMKLFLHILTTKSGGSNVEHTLSFYEISNQIYVDTAYYPNTPVPLTGFKVTDVVLPSLRTDTINDIEVNLPGSGVEFGNYLTRDTSMLFYNNNTPDFRSFFKGLYFKVNSPSSDPYLLSLSLVSNQTTYNNYFVLFIHDTLGAAKEYSFILDAKNTNANFDIFTHNYSTATLGDKMAHINTTFRDTLSYVQSLDGVYTKLTLPGLKRIKDENSLGKIAINRAKLVVPVHFKATAGNLYITPNVPSQLFLRYRLKNGKKYTVPDYSLASTVDLSHNFFDGKLDSVAQVYNFNIPAFVQQYLEDATGSFEPELEIYQGTGTKNVILNANKNKNPVKFEFTYTKF
jgi:Domain of unknown function (DUF4270)